MTNFSGTPHRCILEFVAEIDWAQLIVTSVGGGAVVKLLDYIHTGYVRKRERRETARDVLLKHHDPILKAADELVGRIRSMAVSDFADFRPAAIAKLEPDVVLLRKAAAIFYFVQFWARIQLLRLETSVFATGSDPAGSRLQKFLQQLESRSARVVDRAWQRATGEAILVDTNQGRRPINLYEFAQRYQSDSAFRRWLSPMAEILESAGTDPAERQRILKYGTVVHALIDTLDPNHVVTTERDAWPNKLSPAVRKKLAFGTFREHLPFVPDVRKYTDPKKLEGPRRPADESLE